MKKQGGYIPAIVLATLMGASGGRAASVTLTNASFELEPAGTGWTIGTGGGTGNIGWGLRNNSPGFSPTQTDGSYKGLFHTTITITGTGTVYQTPLTALAPNTVYTLWFDVGNRGSYTTADDNVTLRAFMTLGAADVDHWENGVGTAFETTLDKVPNGGWLLGRKATFDTSGLGDLNQPLNIVLWVERRPVTADTAQGAFDNVALTVVERHYVDGASGDDAWDGTSWSQAFASVTQALAQADMGDEIWVAQGVYVPGDARTDTFSVPERVALYGGFTSGMSSLEQRDPAAYPTVLSGEIGAAGATDNCYRVVTLQGVTGVVIDGFRIEDAHNDAAATAGNGGGIYAYGSGFTLLDSRIERCASTNYGGGLFIDGAGSDPVINGNTFVSNTTYRSGGGLYCANLGTAFTLPLSNCVFTGNAAMGSAYAIGGGVGISGVRLSVVDCVFSNNSASPTWPSTSCYGGGAIGIASYAARAEVRDSVFAGNAARNHGVGGAFYARHIPANLAVTSAFYNCVFRENESEGPYNPGGGAVAIRGCRAVLSNCVFESNQSLYHAGGFGQEVSLTADRNLHMQDCVFSNNTAATGRVGGAMYLRYSNMLIERTEMAGNTGPAAGGGVFSSDSVGEMRNCSLVGNTMVSHGTFGGGGAMLYGGEIDFVNCTLATNTAVRGGALHLAGDAIARLRNSILWGNAASSGPDEINIVAGVLTNYYSDIAGSGGSTSWQTEFGADGGGNIDADPLFAAIGAYDVHLKSGGGRWTAGGWVTDAHDSPGIDAGDPTMSVGDEPTPHGDRINMGRYGGTAEASKTRPAGTVILLR